MHKMTGHVKDPERLVNLVHKSLFCMQKPQLRAGTIETSNSGVNEAVLHAKTTDEVWDQ